MFPLLGIKVALCCLEGKEAEEDPGKGEETGQRGQYGKCKTGTEPVHNLATEPEIPVNESGAEKYVQYSPKCQIRAKRYCKVPPLALQQHD